MSKDKDNSSRIQLINKTDKLIFKPEQQIEIQLEASCDVFADNEGVYYWKYRDNKGTTRDYGTTRENKVMLTFPNFYCGREMTISVSVNSWEVYGAQMQKYVQNGIQKFDTAAPNFPSNGQLSADLHITPLSERKWLSIDWYEEYTVLDYNFIPLRTNRLYIADIELAGFNGESIDIRLYTNKSVNTPIGYYECRSFRVTDNMIRVPVYVEDKFFQNDADNTRITLLIEIYHKDKLYTTLKKDMIIVRTSKVDRIESTPPVPVVVGDPFIVDNNFNPCKYTEIIALYESGPDKKKYTKKAYDEVYKTEPGDLIIIGGNRHVEINLKNYKTDSCKTQKHHPVNEAVLSNGKMEQPAYITIEKDEKFNFDLKYDYKISDADLLLSPAVNSVESKLFPFIWPKREGLIQSKELAINTCRHSKTLKFNLYPDIKWELYFFLTPENEYEVKHKNLPEGHRYAKAQKRAIEVGNLGKGDKFKDELQFGVSLAAQWEDEQKRYDLSANYVDKIAFFVSLFSQIKCRMNQLMGCGSSKGASELKQIANKLPKSKFCPVILTIEYPNIKIGGEWWLEMDEEQKAHIAGSIDIAADPLLAGSGGLDLIALAEYIPVAGQIIKALDWTISALGTDINLSVELFGELSLSLSHKFLPQDSVTELTTTAKLGVRAKLSVSGQIKVLFILKADYEVSGMAESYFTFGGTIGNDNDGCYLAPEITFSGIRLVLVFKIAPEKGGFDRTVSILIAGKENKNGELEKFVIVDKTKYHIIKKE